MKKNQTAHPNLGLSHIFIIALIVLVACSSNSENQELLVDGPPGQIQKHSRYPAVPLLKKFFKPNSIVVVDDSDRTDEQEIIDCWLLENPEFCANHLKTVKGMCILKQKI